ncbi:hypothetical protein [Nocardioides aurantiacus]|uniref:hypothetical protein n=1 Tax=Nocardioides aurantiacus TaxID=86796 RepID=UPI0011CD6620|nr:hypothetical protein [Nocardioides aurantiacus]
MRVSSATCGLFVTLTLAALSACGWPGAGRVPLEDEKAFLDAAREKVQSAREYGNGDLVEMAERVCYMAAVPQGARLIGDEYGGIATRDRELLAYISLTEGCPIAGGTTDRL